jgi:hypothetical protein
VSLIPKVILSPPAPYFIYSLSPSLLCKKVGRIKKREEECNQSTLYAYTQILE